MAESRGSQLGIIQRVAACRFIHAITLVLTLIGAYLITRMYASLYDSPSDTLSAVGTFATFYGLIFAAVELLRLKSVSQQVVQASDKAFRYVRTLTVTERATECKYLIHEAQDKFDVGKPIPTKLIDKILEIHAWIFQSESRDSSSDHYKSRLILQSYDLRKGGLPDAEKQQVRTALIAIHQQMVILMVETQRGTRS